MAENDLPNFLVKFANTFGIPFENANLNEFYYEPAELSLNDFIFMGPQPEIFEPGWTYLTELNTTVKMKKQNDNGEIHFYPGTYAAVGNVGGNIEARLIYIPALQPPAPAGGRRKRKSRIHKYKTKKSNKTSRRRKH